jgi:hypothetical protein
MFGNNTSKIRTKLTLGITTLLFAASGVLAAELNLNWYTVDGGGAMGTTGGNFKLSGTIGQLDASSTTQTGGNYKLTGGFWKPAGRTLDTHTTVPSNGEHADDTPHVPDQADGCPEPGATSSYCTADIWPNNGDGVWDYADDGDCIIDHHDLGALLANYRIIMSGATREDGDIWPIGEGDGAVDVGDLGAMVGQYLDNCN